MLQSRLGAGEGTVRGKRFLPRGCKGIRPIDENALETDRLREAMVRHVRAPSPTSAMTGRSGCANLAAMAYGTAAPMEARPPEREAIIPRRMRKSRAYQLAQEPESLVRITRSGKRGESSHVTRWGLTGTRAITAPVPVFDATVDVPNAW